jgi:multipile epidermal growth factor-like domains protein 8
MDEYFNHYVSFLDEVVPKISEDSLNNWACVTKSNLPKTRIIIEELDTCPSKCHTYQDCQSCLESKGAEGGTRNCHWATHLNQCLAPTYQPLYCAGGVCGLVLNPKQMEQCPFPCSNFTQCDKCLHHAHCGWCALDGANGVGVCSEGSLEGPGTNSPRPTCKSIYELASQESLDPNDTVSWNFVRCPPENECENGHHKCDRVSERCENLYDEYRCVCGSGHRDSGGVCVPFCRQGCVRGTCVRPDVCKCDFGYVGANCSIQCQCNGHSDCEGPDKLNKCMECHNNTMVSGCMPLRSTETYSLIRACPT